MVLDATLNRILNTMRMRVHRFDHPVSPSSLFTPSIQDTLESCFSLSRPFLQDPSVVEARTNFTYLHTFTSTSQSLDKSIRYKREYKINFWHEREKHWVKSALHANRFISVFRVNIILMENYFYTSTPND